MRKVMVLECVSLDGVIQSQGGPEEDPSGGFAYGGWTARYADEVTGTVSPGGVMLVNDERAGALPTNMVWRQADIPEFARSIPTPT